MTDYEAKARELIENAIDGYLDDSAHDGRYAKLSVREHLLNFAVPAVALALAAAEAKGAEAGYEVSAMLEAARDEIAQLKAERDKLKEWQSMPWNTYQERVREKEAEIAQLKHDKAGK